MYALTAETIHLETTVKGKDEGNGETDVVTLFSSEINFIEKEAPSFEKKYTLMKTETNRKCFHKSVHTHVHICCDCTSLHVCMGLFLWAHAFMHAYVV